MFDGDGFLVGQPIFWKQFTEEQNPLLQNEMVNIHGLETARNVHTFCDTDPLHLGVRKTRSLVIH